MTGIAQVISAWEVEGRAPSIHRSARRTVRESWRELAEAIDRAVVEQDHPQSLVRNEAALAELLTRHREPMSPEHGTMQWIAGSWPALHKALARLVAENQPAAKFDPEAVGTPLCECDRPDLADDPHRHERDVACIYWIAGRPSQVLRQLAADGRLPLTAGEVHDDPKWAIVGKP